MAISLRDISTFATTGTEAAGTGQDFDLDYQFFQGSKPIKTDKIEAADVSVKRDPLGSKDFLDPTKKGDEEDATDGALTQLKKSISRASTPVSNVNLTPTLTSVGGGYSANLSAVTDVRVPTSMGAVSAAAGVYEGMRGQGDEYYDYISSLADQYQVDDTGSAAYDAQQSASILSEGIGYAADAGFISGDPITSVGGYKLAGYDPKVISDKYGSYQEFAQGSTAAPTLAGQVAGAGLTVASAYSAFDAMKGGIDNPMEGAQAVSGIIGTVAGLNAMGLISTPGFMAYAGPVGWALAGASLLYETGLIGGKGKSKHPMGGIEFRLVDDEGNQYGSVQENKNTRIKAVNAHSYNGFNSSALASQANKQVDYLYAFADHFDLEVNEDVWANAAFGANNTPIYMPKGREAPYKSVLERIDSEGDGSSSPTEWLRHALEYQSPDGRRIVDGDIYKGVRIGPDGMPMKVGYKNQEAFQEAVANFNKQFYA